MTYFYILVLLLVLVSTKVNNANEQLVKKYKESNNILPGAGYATDTSSPAPTACFKTLSISKGSQSSTLRFDTSIDFSSILDTFDAKAEMKVGIGAFGANASAKYFKSIQDDSYSYSISYFQKVSQKVSFSYSYKVDTILNTTGKAIYENGENPMFRLFCGDYLLRSYTEGAGLIFTYKLRFTSREDKENFSASIGANYGGFISASTSIETTSKKFGMNGFVSITAFQYGGDPAQLSKVFLL